MTSRVIKCGFGGSGNYLVWRIIKMLQDGTRQYRSFRVESGIASMVRHMVESRSENAGLWKWPEEAEIDGMAGMSHEMHEPGFRYAPCSTKLVDDVSSLIWTTDKPQYARENWPNRTHRVYVYRDGRDAVASILHKVVRPDALMLNPLYQARTIEEVLALPGYVERLARKWRDHVTNYLAERDDVGWIPVKYEDLCGARKPLAVMELAHALKLPCSRPLLDSILAATDPDASKKHNPVQVRRASPGGHRELGITDRVESVCPQELVWMGYDLSKRVTV